MPRGAVVPIHARGSRSSEGDTRPPTLPEALGPEAGPVPGEQHGANTGVGGVITFIQVFRALEGQVDTAAPDAGPRTSQSLRVRDSSNTDNRNQLQPAVKK